MYFSKVSLKPDKIVPSQLAGLAGSDAYRTHQQVWDWFAGDREQRRDFLYRRDEERGWPTYYLVSKRPPVDGTGLWEISVKLYEPILRQGQRLTFMLRANPTRAKPGQDGRSRRHDVVMDRKHALRQQDEGTGVLPPREALLRETGLAWLRARAELCGFAYDDEAVRVNGFQQQGFMKRGNPAPIRVSTMDFAGLLTVVDGERLRSALIHGIGPAKAFGCGLLLVRRM